MAGKSLIPFIGPSSNSTYNLTGEPTPANQLIPMEEYTMEGVIAQWEQPLAAVLGSPANLEPVGELLGLLRPLMASEKERAAESRSLPPKKVKYRLTPPPIVRALGQFLEDEVKSPEPSIHKLAAQVKKLRKENVELRDCNAELGVELAEIRNNFDILSRGLCAKIKRAFIEMGKENKYYAN
uniref:Uncharacterized protein n=1 Tax=Oryza sativa subsp. japonica TaxID=39947 RepID=Q2QTE1_ORYSJ|nr:hypothetical protein LOC_Os12g19960 [Oryza sativa Japonica Group]